MKEAKQVIVVRKDLNMRKGKIAAQVAHASLGAYFKACEQKGYSGAVQKNGVFLKDTPMFQWLTGPFTKICVSVDSEKELLDLVEKAKEKKILHCLITDAGKTEFNGVPTNTCAAFGPEWCDVLDQLTGHLKLL
jgi:PTH2 family peptidyl-tRNA hydrolase